MTFIESIKSVAVINGKLHVDTCRFCCWLSGSFAEGRKAEKKEPVVTRCAIFKAVYFRKYCMYVIFSPSFSFPL